MMRAVRREQTRVRTEIMDGIAEYQEDTRRERRDRKCGTIACDTVELWRLAILSMRGLAGREPLLPRRNPAYLH